MAATATAMSSTLAVVLLCAASLVATGAAGGHYIKAKGDDLVAKTCANVTTPPRHYMEPGLTRQFCESALRSDKRSAAASHPRDLALVAMDLVQKGAADAGTKVDGALRSGTAAKWDKYTMLCLKYCREDQNDLAHITPECRALVQEYNPRAGGPPNGPNDIPFVYLQCVKRLTHAAHDCWVNLEYDDGEVKKAVWMEVDEVARRANLAKAMVEQMVDVVDDDDGY